MVVAISARNTKVYTKFANFTRLYFPHFTHFSMLFPGIYFFANIKQLVYNGNCLLKVLLFHFAIADVASTFYASSTEEIYKGQMGLEELNRFSGLSLPNKEIWLDEFCRIRKSKNLTIESYYAMRKCDFFYLITIS
jgi:hypothetical protein